MENKVKSALKLYDEDLQGVNPYDPNLSQEMKLKIIMECKRNLWYFVRDVMRIKENITISEMTQLIINNCKITTTTTTCAGCPIFKHCNGTALKIMNI